MLAGEMIVDMGGEEIADEFVPQVADEVYEKVFASADWVIRQQPWQKFSEENCFVIIDPESGERQLAVLFGAGGSFQALHLYLPPQGLWWFDEMQRTGGQDPNLQQLGLFEQRLLEVEFLDSSFMQGHDYGLNVRFAPECWDECDSDVLSLRSVHPGYAPDYAEEEELLRIRDGLELLRRFCEEDFLQFARCKYPLEAGEKTLLPTYSLPEGGSRENPSDWEVELAELPQEERPKPEVPDVGARFDPLQELALDSSAHWEVGCSYDPEPVLSEGRLAFPLLVLVIDSHTEEILAAEAVTAPANRIDHLRQTVVLAASKAGRLPHRLSAFSATEFEALRSLDERFGVQVSECEPEGSAFAKAIADLSERGAFAD